MRIDGSQKKAKPGLFPQAVSLVSHFRNVSFTLLILRTYFSCFVYGSFSPETFPWGTGFSRLSIYLYIRSRLKLESASAAEHRASGRSRAGRPEASVPPPCSGSRPCVHVPCSSGCVGRRVSDMRPESAHLRPWPQNVQVFAGGEVVLSAQAPSAKRMLPPEARGLRLLVPVRSLPFYIHFMRVSFSCILLKAPDRHVSESYPLPQR